MCVCVCPLISLQLITTQVSLVHSMTIFSPWLSKQWSWGALKCALLSRLRVSLKPTSHTVALSNLGCERTTQRQFGAASRRWRVSVFLMSIQLRSLVSGYTWPRPQVLTLWVTKHPPSEEEPSDTRPSGYHAGSLSLVQCIICTVCPYIDSLLQYIRMGNDLNRLISISIIDITYRFTFLSSHHRLLI